MIATHQDRDIRSNRSDQYTANRLSSLLGRRVRGQKARFNYGILQGADACNEPVLVLESTDVYTVVRALRAVLPQRCLL